MSLQDAFREVKQGKYEYHFVEMAIDSLEKEKRLKIIEENLIFLISLQDSDNADFKCLSHRLLKDAITDWANEAIINNESYDHLKKCLEFLVKRRRLKKYSTTISIEDLRILIDKINILMEEYEIRKKTEEAKRVIEE